MMPMMITHGRPGRSLIEPARELLRARNGIYVDERPGELAGSQQRLSDSCDRTIELVDGFIVSDATNTGNDRRVRA